MKLDFDIETKSPKLEFDMKGTRVVSTGGGISENRVQQIVEEKTKDLQPKTDETLETNSKQIVGAINEVNKKAGQVGSQGKDGVGVEKVEQTVISTDDKGENIITITLTNGEEYTFTVLNGSKGSQGERGEDGYTPIKGIDYFDGKDGKDGKDGTNGTNGRDGYTPIKGTDYFDGKDGAQGEKGDKGDKGDNGSQGQQGEKGADGYTPVKGTDYITESDISEMVQAVISALPKYNGEVIEI